MPAPLWPLVSVSISISSFTSCSAGLSRRSVVVYSMRAMFTPESLDKYSDLIFTRAPEKRLELQSGSIDGRRRKNKAGLRPNEV